MTEVSSSYHQANAQTGAFSRISMGLIFRVEVADPTQSKPVL